ncbi:MAG: hypothetical protein AB7O48_15310 [Cyclobacteriaceae bacterium]
MGKRFYAKTISLITMSCISDLKRKLKGFTILATLLSLLSFAGLGNVRETRVNEPARIELRQAAPKSVKRSIRFQHLASIVLPCTGDFNYRTLHSSLLLAVLLRHHDELDFLTDHRNGIQAFLRQAHPHSPDPHNLRA